MSKKELNLISKNILNSIPDGPKIPLDNYLLDLTHKSDGKEKSLYIRDLDPFIKEIWDDIVRNNYRKLNVRKLIPMELGISLTIFYANKNGKKGISIQSLYKLLVMWKKYCNKSIQDFNKKWDEIFKKEYSFSVSAYYVRTRLPKHINPRLSYLIGWIIGDGNMGFYKHGYIISIADKSKEQLDYILKPILKEFFNIDAPIFVSMGKGFRIQFGSKPLFRFLKGVLKLEVGKIPRIINKFDNINLRYFLLGILDSEGYISKSAKDPKITISQSCLEFQKQLIFYFKMLDITFKGPYFHKTKLGEWYTIRVRKKKDILKFDRIVGSCHIDKHLRLKNLVDQIDKVRHM